MSLTLAFVRLKTSSVKAIARRDAVAGARVQGRGGLRTDAVVLDRAAAARNSAGAGCRTRGRRRRRSPRRTRRPRRRPGSGLRRGRRRGTGPASTRRRRRRSATRSARVGARPLEADAPARTAGLGRARVADEEQLRGDVESPERERAVESAQPPPSARPARRPWHARSDPQATRARPSWGRASARRRARRCCGSPSPSSRRPRCSCHGPSITLELGARQRGPCGRPSSRGRRSPRRSGRGRRGHPPPCAAWASIGCSSGRTRRRSTGRPGPRGSSRGAAVPRCGTGRGSGCGRSGPGGRPTLSVSCPNQRLRKRWLADAPVHAALVLLLELVAVLRVVEEVGEVREEVEAVVDRVGLHERQAGAGASGAIRPTACSGASGRASVGSIEPEAVDLRRWRRPAPAPGRSSSSGRSRPSPSG